MGLPDSAMVNRQTPRRQMVADQYGLRFSSQAFVGTGNDRPWPAVVCSRLGRNPLAHRLEIATLYRWVRQTFEADARPLASVGTAAHPWVTRACRLLGRFPIELRLATDSASGISRQPNGTAAGHCRDVVTVESPAASLCRDSLAIALADRVDVAFVRRGGTVHRLLLKRLADDPDAAVRVLVPVPSWGQPLRPDWARVIDELIHAGAVGYCCRWDGVMTQADHPQEPRNDSPATVIAAETADESADQTSVSRVETTGNPRKSEVRSVADSADRIAMNALLAEPNRWLFHCTRGRQGAWPGQSEDQFRDGLLLAAPVSTDLSPLATLQRIVGQRRLIGDGRTVRGGRPVVCFSDLPILDAVGRRVFRSHLGRWDAEPYGIAIDRSVAASSGACPVVYVDPDFTKKSEVECDAGPLGEPTWRLQPRGKTIDWRAECEWRWPGGVDLRSLRPHEAVVFVATDAEIARIVDSPWPVVSVESLKRLAGDGVARNTPLR
jgi:hypothetical protein